MRSPLTRLCHITLQVSNPQKVIADLVAKYRFRPFAARGLDGAAPCQVALRNGEVVFIVNEISKSPDLLYDSAVPLTSPDTACNVSYEVDDLSRLCQRLVSNGCHMLVPPTHIQSDAGPVSYCVVKSILGNVRHTLIDRTQYAAAFLPGFDPLKKDDDGAPADVTRVDHVTYCCPRGTVPQVIEWYRRCFGFQHFPLREGEDPSRGFEISGPQIGLRLTSVECPERAEVAKIVFAESLPQTGMNQINQFLQHHPEGGIQHIGLLTPNILKAVRALTDSGVVFAHQPPSYYNDPQKVAEILRAGLTPQRLSPFGILLDSSPELQDEKDADLKFLLQVFAEPLFFKDSLYLELIERRGAQGFGEGNIRALWRSMQDMINGLSQKVQEGAVTQ
ncbi:4-hydroxyphenylpyruvate dioxygenase-like protein [Bufo gargarizans]|uniref:4-hydroxyphenylpyruvate dioxygenase-like protein n=1 Tax=Bufo gargarizans TaxID=30331 RepID=UPI001CF55B22|nr:4-hydroxyphenylpyruvate dioxygenase-like protein [Bufo gargarizans]XP_044157658.1 4-hydroxyphenylpyruvate dioxygenase-like protein [Bufo gargarizans]XP_044157659.1 4-hydroxyphenylpyruvate dioxygenase-like protein [Bufo gargarizans]